MSTLPLAGLRVLALEQAVAAPFCSRQLADLGADVVKVERPDGGDFARHYDGALNGTSAYFAWLNRGKRSVVLDLKQAAERAQCAELLARADVFVHNLAPGAVERFGFGYDELRASNAELVWCGISGYGPDGPYREKKAYDLLVQAEAGVVALTGTAETPCKVGISIADIAAGLYGYSSILAALLRRQHSGQGERIDISMLECLTEWAHPPLYVWQGTGREPARMGARHNMIVPYGLYPCADGAVTFAVQNEREWQRFCTLVLEAPELLEDARFAGNAQRLAHRDELEARIEAHFASLPSDVLIERLERAEIANAAVNALPAVAAHPQLAARGRWVQGIPTPDGLIAALLPPHNLQSAAARMGPVPALGQHTAEVLAELQKDGR
jgi:crotonobetainyl-CoA:carnitine CoA-transferase CaiB-like acyl-CoA transferase